MKFRIYQINTDRDKQGVCFMNLEKMLCRGEKQVDSSLYDGVYTGEIPSDSLEEVYRVFNLEHPADYCGRSLSVSDVVVVTEADQLKPGAYFCDSFGFQRIEFDQSRTNQRAVEHCRDFREKRISVLLVEPGKQARMTTIGDSLEEMQKLVGGDVEEYMPFADEVAILCNEEGKLRGLPLNRAIYDDRGRIQDVIAGTFFLTYAPIDSDHFLSLPEHLAGKYEALFREPERFVRIGGQMQAVKLSPKPKEHVR